MRTEFRPAMMCPKTQLNSCRRVVVGVGYRRGSDRQLVSSSPNLPVVDTKTTGFRIFPFVARIIPPNTWNRQAREVAEIVDVRVRDLVRPEAHGQEEKHFPTWSAPRQTPFYQVGSYQIWGATYRILQPLIPRLLAGDWDV